MLGEDGVAAAHAHADLGPLGKGPHIVGGAARALADVMHESDRHAEFAGDFAQCRAGLAGQDYCDGGGVLGRVLHAARIARAPEGPAGVAAGLG